MNVAIKEEFGKDPRNNFNY